MSNIFDLIMKSSPGGDADQYTWYHFIIGNYCRQRNKETTCNV